MSPLPRSSRTGLWRLWWSSLPLRVLLTTVAASLAVLTLAGLLLLQQATNAIVETKKSSAVAEAAGIHSFMQQQLRSPEMRNVSAYEQLNRLAEEAGAQGGQYYVAIQGPATVLLSENIRLSSIPEDLREATTNSDAMFVAPTSVEYGDAASEPGWVIGASLYTSGERFPIYYVFPMSSEVATLGLLRGAIVTTGLILVVALTAIAYLVTGQVVRPVRKASQTALRLASGSLDERMNVRGTDDLASLAESMNLMAEDLQQRIRELERLSMVQRRFVSDVSHELRTPMTTIKMASEVLYGSRHHFSPEAARTAELMSVEIERFDVLLADLLEISRFDAGAAVLSIEETDLVALMRDEVQAQRAFAESQLTVLNLQAPDSATASVDPRRIRRIVRNLLTNAIEHAEQQPIEVRVGANDSAIAITVRDYGVGFEAAESGQVFERFWRADPSRTRVVGGSGLGLSIALEDARLHDGWLSAWGRPGVGAQFRLTLPRQRGVPIQLSPLPERPEGQP